MAKSSDDNRVNVLFTSAGRRVALVDAFRESARALKLKTRLVACDVNPLSPALYRCDTRLAVSAIRSGKYIGELLEIIDKYNINLVVPTIDTELKILAKNRAKFQAKGATVLVSTSDVIDICQDKRLTSRFLEDNGFDTPRTWTLDQLEPTKLKFPLYMKPWDGSAGAYTQVVRDREEFDFFAKRVPNCIVQQVVSGQEHTCDVYVDATLRVRCVVPRKRIEIRTGEVSRAQTVKIPAMMDRCKALVETLGAGPGVITVQCFLSSREKISFIEINPRFGGGAPLSIKAGADFPKWLLQETANRRPAIGWDRWRDKLYMLRYADAVFCAQDAAGETLKVVGKRNLRPGTKLS